MLEATCLFVVYLFPNHTDDELKEPIFSRTGFFGNDFEVSAVFIRKNYSPVTITFLTDDSPSFSSTIK